MPRTIIADIITATLLQVLVAADVPRSTAGMVEFRMVVDPELVVMEIPPTEV
jgi:hypothetical protein